MHSMAVSDRVTVTLFECVAMEGLVLTLGEEEDNHESFESNPESLSLYL